jgi:hypothetical protein
LYFRENHLVYFLDPFDQWFIFRYDDDAGLFNDPRISADRVKGFVDATPFEPK